GLAGAFTLDSRKFPLRQKTPDHDDKNPNRWQISVTIGTRLRADLNETNDRHQHPQKPKPADGRKWPASREKKRRESQSAEQRSGSEGCRGRKINRVRIKDG